MIKTRGEFMNTCGIQSKRVKESLKNCSRYTEAENGCNMPVFVHAYILFHILVCAYFPSPMFKDCELIRASDVFQRFVP